MRGPFSRLRSRLGSRQLAGRLAPALVAVAALACAACGSGPSNAGNEPEARIGEAGVLEFALDMLELHEGPSRLALDIVEVASGEPCEGAALFVEPFMPSMGHGTTEKPAVTDAGHGHYELRVVFPMPGTWDLHVRAEKGGGVADEATFTLDVP